MQIVGYVLACRSHSFVCTLHHLIITIVQTHLKTLNLQNACQIYFGECMSKAKHIFSVIHYTKYGAACFQLTHFPYDDREYVRCLITIIKSEVWTIIHCLGLGHGTMVCAVCLSIFLWWSSYGNIFLVTGPLWGEPPVTGGFPSQRPVSRSFDVLFDVRLNIWLRKQSICRWFVTPWCLLWHHSNEEWDFVWTVAI